MKAPLAASVVLLLAALAAPSARADASALDEARTLTAQATIEYDVGHFDQALDLYTRAYERFPKPALLFDIGQCQRLLGHPDRAIFFFQGYLRGEPRAPNRAIVERLIAEAQQKLDEARAHSADANQSAAAPPGEGAAVRPASEVTPTEAIGTGAMAPSSSSLSASQSASPSASPPAASSVTGDAAPGGSSPSSPSATSQSSPPYAASTASPSPPGSSSSSSSPSSSWSAARIAGVATAGAGVVLLGAAVVEGLHAASLSSQISQVAAQHGTWTAQEQSTYDSGRAAATASDVLCVAGGVALAAGAVITWLAWPRAIATAAVAPIPGGAAASLAGSF